MVKKSITKTSLNIDRSPLDLFFCPIKLATKSTCVLVAAAALAVAQPHVISPTSAGNTGAAPIGIAATTSQLLFTQPFCPPAQTRGVYSANPVTGASTLVAAITAGNPSLCSENYMAISPGLDGFTAGDYYVTAASTVPNQELVLKNGTTVFASGINAPTLHAGITFDQVGTFGGALIVLSNGAVIGYNSAGAIQFTYSAPANYVLEGGAVAPLSFTSCPGCLFVTGELMTDVNSASQTGPGAIFYVNPGMPSGTPVSLFALTPGIIEPEGLQFVTSNSLSCSNNGYSYFVSSYASGPQIDTAHSTNGTILEFTPAQLAPYVGDFLVPNETNGTIYAFSGTGTPSIFFQGSYQFEGSSILQCPSGRGCPLTQGYWKNHTLPSAMFNALGNTSIGCQLYTSAQIHAILETNNAGGNAVTILGHQLIAAIANYDNGAKQTAAASAAIALSISLLCTNHIDLQTSFVQAGTSLGQQLTALANTLDAYNSSCE